MSVETGFETSTLADVLMVDVSNRSVSVCSANKHPLVAGVLLITSVSVSRHNTL